MNPAGRSSPPGAIPGAILDAPALLTLTRWLSPAFPTGAFAWSHGVEQAARDGAVRDAATLRDWLDAALRWGAGRTDAILLASAHRAGTPEALAEVAALADALAPSRERRAEALGQGAAFAAAIRGVEGWDLPDMPLPAAIGRAARLGGLPVLPVAQVALLAWVTHLAQAAQRLMPLGQTGASRVVAALAPACAEVAAEGVALTLDDLGSCAFALDVASMRHEALEPRLFRS